MEKIEISKNKKDINIDIVTNYLRNESYWAKGRSINKIQISIDNSICYSLFLKKDFIGFARVITDRATFAYLCDVFITKQHQRHGYGKKLLEYIINDSELKDITIYLLTLDGHKFYEKYKFVSDDDLIRRVMRRISK